MILVQLVSLEERVLFILGGIMKHSIGCYDENAFKGRLSVNIFERILLESRRAIPYIPVGDTAPNFDGDISICKIDNGKYLPRIRLAVQVKTLPKDYHNKVLRNNLHKYKYSCDTKLFFSVLAEYTRDLVYLIMVDIPNERVFALPITKEYCVSLRLRDGQAEKTIYFDDTEKISNVDNWILLVQEHYKKMVDIKHDSENIKLIIPYSSNIPNHVTDAVNYINHIMDNEFSFIKRHLFPEVWNFGISYMPKEGMHEESFGIFEIKKNDNEYVRRFDKEYNQNLYEITSKNVHIKDSINYVIDDWLNRFSKDMHTMYSFMPNIVLVELLFENVDKLYHDNISNTKSEDVIYLHQPKDYLYYEEVLQIEEIDSDNTIKLLLNELEKRGINKFVRPWRVSFNYSVEKSDVGNKLVAVEDVTSLDNENNKRFAKNLGDVCKETLSLWGEKARSIFRNVNYSLTVTSDFSLGRCIISESSELQISLVIEDTKNFRVPFRVFMTDLSIDAISRFEFKFHIEHSWYALWYRFSLLSFRDFLQSNVNEKNKAPLIDSLIGNLIVQ